SSNCRCSLLSAAIPARSASSPQSPVPSRPSTVLARPSEVLSHQSCRRREEPVTDDPTLLVVDHDEDLVRMVASTADAFGFRVVSERRTQSALARMSDLKPDAALVDLSDVDARTVLNEIGAVDPQCPVILMTR